MLKRKKIVLLLVVLCLLVVVASTPIISVSVVPEIRLKAVDKEDNDVVGIVVIQDWTHLSFESIDHSNQEISNKTGYVIFPERNIRISLLRLIVGKMIEQIDFINPHANTGPFSSFRVPGYSSYSPTYRKGKDLPQKIVIEK